MAANKKLLVLPGDGIGPEVMDEVERVAGWFDRQRAVSFDLDMDLVGGAAIDAHGEPLAGRGHGSRTDLGPRIHGAGRGDDRDGGVRGATTGTARSRAAPSTSARCRSRRFEPGPPRSIHRWLR